MWVQAPAAVVVIVMMLRLPFLEVGSKLHLQLPHNVLLPPAAAAAATVFLLLTVSEAGIQLQVQHLHNVPHRLLQYRCQLLPLQQHRLKPATAELTRATASAVVLSLQPCLILATAREEATLNFAPQAVEAPIVLSLETPLIYLCSPLVEWSICRHPRPPLLIPLFPMLRLPLCLLAMRGLLLIKEIGR